MIAWATDTHLDYAEQGACEKFYGEVRGSGAEALLLCGDVSNGHRLTGHLAELALLGIPVYFVLGNHDFYGSSIAQSRHTATRMAAEHGNLHYLTKMPHVSLSENVALMGHDGWYDARNGRVGGVILNDFRLIEDFKRDFLTGGLMNLRFKELAQEAADHFRSGLAEAFKSHRKVVLVTHVPPFSEASWFEGRHSSIEFMPYFSSKVEGVTLMETMETRPGNELLVLCGHSHGSGRFQPLPNLTVLTGGAEYGCPSLQKETLDI